MSAIEKFRKTQVWVAPPGLDFPLDVHEIKRLAEGQVVRSRETSENSLARISVSGPPGGGGGGGGKTLARPNTAPIKKKKAPLSARGRMQEGGAIEDGTTAPSRAVARPSSARSASQSYTQNISEEDMTDSSPSPAHVSQPAAEVGESEEGEDGAQEYEGAQQHQECDEQEYAHEHDEQQYAHERDEQQYAHEHVKSKHQHQYANEIEMVDIRISESQYRNEPQVEILKHHLYIACV